MDDTSQQQWAEQVVEAVTEVFPDGDFENWVQCDRLIAQAQATTGLISVYGLASETAALLLVRTGYYYDSQGRYEESEPLYLESLAMMKRLLGEAHPSVASSLFNLGALHYNQGRYSEAQILLLQAQPIYLAQLGPNHPNTQALQSWIDDTQAALDSQAE